METRHETILKILQKDQPLNINSISEKTGIDRNWVSKSLKELQSMNLINQIDVTDNRNKQFILSTKGFKAADLLKQLEEILKA